MDYETESAEGLNGFILLSHIGAGPDREDKFYLYLDSLINRLKNRDYHLVRMDELLEMQQE